MAPSTTQSAAVALAARNKVNKLLTAARDGDLDRFKEAARIIDEGQGLAKAVADVKDANGRGPLHFAAHEGKVEICKYLVEELSIEVDARDDDGETPLIHAARQGFLDAARYLLEHGADPFATSTKLHAAAIHHAAGTGSVELIILLIDRGVKVDTPSEIGTPLIWAAGHEKFEAMKPLLDFGADVNASSSDGVTALLTAAAAGSFDIVELLVKNGADANITATGGVTPLHVAADHGNEKMTRCLLEGGAKADAVDDEGSTPLQVAALKGHRALVEILLPHTTPIKAVSSWTVEGVLAYGEQQHGLGQGSVEETKIASDQLDAQVVEVTPELKAKSLEAKARGDESFRQKEFMLAIDAYTQALELDPYNAVVLSNRSLCWIRTGQAELALADAKAARVLRPEWSKVYYREGSALRLLQRYEEAANVFFEGLKIEPEHSELRNALRDTVEAGKKFHKENLQTQEAAN